MLKNIEIAKRITNGLKGDKKPFAKRYKLFGADTETVKGEPLSLQFYDGNDEKDVKFIWVNKRNVFEEFYEFITENALEGYPNYYYYHNLAFDMGIIFFPYLKDFTLHNQIEFEYEDIKVNAIYGTTTTAKILYKKKTTIHLLDSKSFMSGGSLAKWAEVLNLPFKKMDTPEGLGDVNFRRLSPNDKRRKYFVEYAKTDVLTEYHLGEWILNQHKKYDVPIAVSSAHFSSRVFKKDYLSRIHKIPFPPKDCFNGCLLSYHGGRNGYYWDRPAVFENCCEVDISSSYPYAMVSLPNFVDCKYQAVKEYVKGFAGIYEISGIYHKCKYPPFFTHDLKEIADNSFYRVWITSYELEEAIRDGSIRGFRIIQGWIVIPANYNVVNPFEKFVTEFYNKKEKKGIDKTERLMYKIILNSLYGKFIQTIRDDYNDREVSDEADENLIDLHKNKDGSFSVVHAPTSTHLYVAGGLFQPMIATLITGFARAYLHRLEHKYNAIHSSTDSVKFNAKLLERPKLEAYNRKCSGNKDKGVLGDYGVEVIGKCIILRNKLYLHYNRDGIVEKQAFHGFAGRQKELLQVINTGDIHYTVDRMLKIREAARQGLKPFIMTRLQKELDVDLSKLQIVSDKEY